MFFGFCTCLQCVTPAELTRKNLVFQAINALLLLTVCHPVLQVQHNLKWKSLWCIFSIYMKTTSLHSALYHFHFSLLHICSIFCRQLSHCCRNCQDLLWLLFDFIIFILKKFILWTYRDNVTFESMSWVCTLYNSTELWVTHSCLDPCCAHRTCNSQSTH